MAWIFFLRDRTVSLGSPAQVSGQGREQPGHDRPAFVANPANACRRGQAMARASPPRSQAGARSSLTVQEDGLPLPLDADVHRHHTRRASLCASPNAAPKACRTPRAGSWRPTNHCKLHSFKSQRPAGPPPGLGRHEVCRSLRHPRWAPLARNSRPASLHTPGWPSSGRLACSAGGCFETGTRRSRCARPLHDGRPQDCRPSLPGTRTKPAPLCLPSPPCLPVVSQAPSHSHTQLPDPGAPRLGKI